MVMKIGNSKIFICAKCNTYLATGSDVKNRSFIGRHGPAFLFNKVINLNYGDEYMKDLLTGLHMIRDVNCKSCDLLLGWMYEQAPYDNQKFKEGKICLERTLIIEYDSNAALTTKK